METDSLQLFKSKLKLQINVSSMILEFLHRVNLLTSFYKGILQEGRRGGGNE